ncbi:MAG: cation transporter [Bacteroidia bacterium]|nr:cation transporter [Bacteroidia bacterium]
MNKTTFRISKMDCPSEESLIRLKLAGHPGITSLTFDIPNRRLEVLHTNSAEAIFAELDALNLNTSILERKFVEHNDSLDNPASQAKLLRQVLFINLFFFILELITGLFSRSLGLMADSLDMLADSFVYGLALLAVGGSMLKKNRIAAISGYFQLCLALLGLFEVLRRFAGNSESPNYTTMIAISIFALIGNSVCLFLLQKSKSSEAHMKASMIFTSNDVIVNAGVILAGILVYLTESRFPDLIIGGIVFVFVLQGAVRILKLSTT